MAERRLTDLELERWLAEDLPEARRQRATEADRGRLEALRAQQAAWLATVDVAAEVSAIGQRTAVLKPREPAPRRPRAWRWALSGGVLAAAALALIVFVRRPDDVTYKGDLALVIHAAGASNGDARRLASGDTVAAGDRIRFEVAVSAPGYVAIVGIDGTGASTVYYPFGSHEPAAIDPRAGGVLPGAVALDAAPGDERFFAVYATRPFVLDAALFAGLRDGSRRSDLVITEVVLRKRPAQ